MWSSDFRARLEEINRRRVVNTAGSDPSCSPPAASHADRHAPIESPSTTGQVDQRPRPPELRGQVQQNDHGQHLWIRHPLRQIWPDGGRWLAALVARWQDYGHLPEEAHAEMDAVQRFFPDRVFFLDLETCGFAGSMIFLVGLVHDHDGELVLSQLWARNYAEEAAMLVTLWQIARWHRVLVTFNGKSFDWPQVHDRSTLYRLGKAPMSKDAPVHPSPPSLTRALEIGVDDPRPNPIHCDLLHHARRRWKDSLPNCRLQTLEKYICGRRRAGDIPSREIPDVYHDYVRTGETAAVKSVLHHNALDLITLLQLTLRFVMLETVPHDLPAPMARAG